MVDKDDSEERQPPSGKDLLSIAIPGSSIRFGREELDDTEE